MKLKNVFKYFGVICKHKYYVCKYCFKVHLYWQGITHDLSKFSFTEFWDNVKYYNGSYSPVVKSKEINGYSKAWQHHKGRNPHHYEYWTDNYDNGTTTIMMPYKYAVEMLCDYIGAGKSYNKDFSYEKEYEWWKNKWDTVKMNDRTRLFITVCLYELTLMPEKAILNKKHLIETYIRVCNNGEGDESNILDRTSYITYQLQKFFTINKTK